jgi:hypothetical protein
VPNPAMTGWSCYATSNTTKIEVEHHARIVGSAFFLRRMRRIRAGLAGPARDHDRALCGRRAGRHGRPHHGAGLGECSASRW